MKRKKDLSVVAAEPEVGAPVDLRERRLFDSLVGPDGFVTGDRLLEELRACGLQADDPRIRELTAAVRPRDRLDYEAFTAAVRPNILVVERLLTGAAVLPDFRSFERSMRDIFERVRDVREGEVATYIPQLGRVDPEHWGLSICTVDGQRLDLGDSDVDYCVQSTCKPINYCLALEENGEPRVHRHVGREPSGRGFNELTLNKENKPHNPMINAGAIMCCSLIKPEAEIADRFDHVMSQWRRLCGTKVGFSNSVYLSERQTADRNFALGYFMQEKRSFPEGTDLLQTLEFYFQCCSIEVTTRQMALAAATLANGGVNPVTGDAVFSPQTVRNCLSLMYSCGMYDFSGEFAFTIGLPAKSGVSGAVMVVVPNVCGFVTWSPRLDELGNSVRGLAFCRELVQRYNFHNYDNLTGLTEKEDPRVGAVAHADVRVALMWAATKGDLSAIRRIAAGGADLGAPDYDGRTPLHLAASEGHLAVVRFLVDRGVDVVPTDRWGGTPLDDAKRHEHADVAEYLSSLGRAADPSMTG